MSSRASKLFGWVTVAGAVALGGTVACGGKGGGGSASGSGTATATSTEVAANGPSLGAGTGDGKTPLAAGSTEPAPKTSVAPSDKKLGPGKFVYKTKPASDPDDKVIEPLFTEDKMLEGVVKAMGVFALPRDVPVLVTDDGPCPKKLNAFYQPSSHAIFVCYPLANAFYKEFLKGMKDEDATKATRDAIVFTVMHEMGHALIGELELGHAGKEEDAVDELATLILIENKKPEWAVNGTVAMMNVFKTPDKVDYKTFLDEHSVSEARFADVLCMVGGSDLEKYGPAIVKLVPSMERRLVGQCEKNFKNISKFWNEALAKYQR